MQKLHFNFIYYSQTEIVLKLTILFGLNAKANTLGHWLMCNNINFHQIYITCCSET